MKLNVSKQHLRLRFFVALTSAGFVMCHFIPSSEVLFSKYLSLNLSYQYVTLMLVIIFNSWRR